MSVLESRLGARMVKASSAAKAQEAARERNVRVRCFGMVILEKVTSSELIPA